MHVSFSGSAFKYIYITWHVWLQNEEVLNKALCECNTFPFEKLFKALSKLLSVATVMFSASFTSFTYTISYNIINRFLLIYKNKKKAEQNRKKRCVQNEGREAEKEKKKRQQREESERGV